MQFVYRFKSCSFLPKVYVIKSMVHPTISIVPELRKKMHTHAQFQKDTNQIVKSHYF